MKIALTFKEINGLLPTMSRIMQEKLSYDISYKLFQVGKSMDEANDYFVKKYQEIQASEEDGKDEKINQLASTKVELSADYIPERELVKALKEANAKVTPVDILSLMSITEPEVQESGFTIIS
jgi:hypothetical protein